MRIITVRQAREMGLHPCALCNDYEVWTPGDLCGFCAGPVVWVCPRCGETQQQFAPCIHCETGR